MMRTMIQGILEQYGQRVTVETAEGRAEIRAFLQPVTERSEEACGAVTELGGIDSRLWRYLGQTPLESGDLVCWDTYRFRVRSSRPYAIGERVLYWWAALERAREAAE